MVERRENRERWVRETLDEELEPDELERVVRRLWSLKTALDDLAPLVVQTSEPLTMATLEDD